MLGIKMNLGSTGNLGNGMVDMGQKKVFLKGGKKHRLNGPAEMGLDGSEAWFLDGSKHRSGGKPAVTHANGNKEWWENGKLIKKETSKK